MERRARDSRSGQIDRRDDRARRQHARPADLHDDILQNGRFDLRRVFERRGPAWEFCRAAKTCASGEAVELHDRAVDIVAQAVAALIDGCDLVFRFPCGAAERIGNDLKAEAAQIIQRLRVRLKGDALRQLHIENKDIQSALGGDLRVELAQGASRRIARIGKEALPCRLTRLVEAGKAGARHEHLAAHDQPCGRALKRHGNGADGLEIFGHVLADEAVAARRTTHESSIHIFQRDGQAVHLRLNAVDGVRLRLTQPRVEFLKFLKGKNILQAFQRDGVAYLLERADRFAADALRRTQRRGVLRIFAFQLLELPKLPVVLKVRHLRRVEHIILVIGAFQLTAELLHFLSDIHIGHPFSSEDGNCPS